MGPARASCARDVGQVTVGVGMQLMRKAAVGCLALAMLGALALAQPPAKPGVAAVAPGEKEARKKKSLDQLLQQGLDALAAGQYPAAREAFLDVIALDPKQVKAYHGLGLC